MEIFGSLDKQVDAMDESIKAQDHYKKVLEDEAGGLQPAKDYEKRLYQESNPIATDNVIVIPATEMYNYGYYR